MLPNLHFRRVLCGPFVRYNAAQSIHRAARPIATWSKLPMDGRRFDDLLRAVTDSRRSVLGGTLAGLAGVFGLATADAKKKHKRKPCKKKCKDGCCTGKHGKCIKPAQQSSTQCGTGGEICRSTGCGGGDCGAGCDTCCANGECIDVRRSAMSSAEPAVRRASLVRQGRPVMLQARGAAPFKEPSAAASRVAPSWGLPADRTTSVVWPPRLSQVAASAARTPTAAMRMMFATTVCACAPSTPPANRVICFVRRRWNAI